MFESPAPKRDKVNEIGSDVVDAMSKRFDSKKFKRCKDGGYSAETDTLNKMGRVLEVYVFAE